MAKRFPLNPKHPERICWGCDKYCPAGDLACGNGTDRVQHPAELFGEDWYEWGLEPVRTNGSGKSLEDHSVEPTCGGS